MRVPFKWLCEYIRPDRDLDAYSVAEKLTMAGISVESVDRVGTDVRRVQVGKVDSVRKHPNSDRLLVCVVDVGTRRLQLVTGALNVKPGAKVPVALPGALLPRGIEIRVAEFSGVSSEGMVCSAWELGLSDEKPDAHAGVMILPDDAPIGIDLVEYLSLRDEVLVLDLTPNRADCLSVVGVAREVAAVTNSAVVLPPSTVSEEKAFGTEERARVEVLESGLCPRYSARLITDVRPNRSPFWLQRRLQLCGLRSISNVVDVTNYVMIEMGQPLHAFDFSLVRDGHVIVRRADDGEEIVTLDGISRVLSGEMLVIADPEKAIAVAGVIGGKNTEINPDTTEVLLESAHFNGPSVRRTARNLGVSTEASSRFEKWVDPNGTVAAMNRATRLLVEIGAGVPACGWIDFYPHPIPEREIRVRPRYVNSVLKTKLTARKMASFLERLGFQVRGTRGRAGLEEFFVTVPTRRADVVEEVDLVEEIVRLYGYDRLDTRMPHRDGPVKTKPPRERLVSKLRRIMVSMGLLETVTRSYMSQRTLDDFGLPRTHEWWDAIRVKNPMTEDQALLRRSLIPGLLNVLSYNANRGVESLGAFEIGVAYIPRRLPLTELPEERLYLAIALMGRVVEAQWVGEDVPGDYYLLKGMIEAGIRELVGSHAEVDIGFGRFSHPVLHPGRCAVMELGTRRIGVLGELHPELIDRLNLEAPVSVAELELEPLFEVALGDAIKGGVRFEPLPRYPAVKRDIALIVSEEIPASDIARTISEKGGELLREMRLFDVYKGENIPPGKRSLAYSLTYRAEGRTLTEEEVERVHDEIRRALTEEFGATLRS